ncbi:MAG: hypothetical protein KQI35_11065 [Bacteroidetes bacterium]|nr:hypothetical protein [Bacteroidota bacterium]
MDKTEKRILKERQRRLKKKRKEYLREEKKSLRQQKHELKQIRKRRRNGKSPSLWDRFKHLFTRQANETPHHHKSVGPWKRFILWRKERRSFRRNRLEARQKLKHQARTRSKMIKREKVHSRKESRKMKEKTRPMRQKMREARLRHYKELWIGFFKQPIKVKKLKEEEKILRKHIREDIRRQRIKAIQNIPDSISSGFSYKLKIQRDKIRFFFMYLNESFAGRRSLREDPLIRRDLFKTFINSTILFILAFIIVYFSSRLVMIYVARIYDIPAVLYSYRIFWPLYTYSSLYSRPALILIFASGPIFSMLVGLLFYRIFIMLRLYNINFKLFALWMLFHSLNLFFGAYIVGVITRTGFVYATEWLFYSQVFDVEEIIFVIISVILLLVSGFYFTRKFLIATNRPALVDAKIRLFYMFAMVLFPWIMGLGVLLIMNYPYNPPELLLLYSTTLLMIVPTMTNFNSPGNKAIKVMLHKQGVHLGWIYILLTIAALAFIRIYAFDGIAFR